jgi:hypothetical protein
MVFSSVPIVQFSAATSMSSGCFTNSLLYVGDTLENVKSGTTHRNIIRRLRTQADVMAILVKTISRIFSIIRYGGSMD